MVERSVSGREERSVLAVANTEDTRGPTEAAVKGSTPGLAAREELRGGGCGFGLTSYLIDTGLRWCSAVTPGILECQTSLDILILDRSSALPQPRRAEDGETFV